MQSDGAPGDVQRLCRDPRTVPDTSNARPLRHPSATWRRPPRAGAAAYVLTELLAERRDRGLSTATEYCPRCALPKADPFSLAVDKGLRELDAAGIGKAAGRLMELLRESGDVEQVKAILSRDADAGLCQPFIELVARRDPAVADRLQRGVLDIDEAGPPRPHGQRQEQCEAPPSPPRPAWEAQ